MSGSPFANKKLLCFILLYYTFLSSPFYLLRSFHPTHILGSYLLVLLHPVLFMIMVFIFIQVGKELNACHLQAHKTIFQKPLHTILREASFLEKGYVCKKTQQITTASLSRKKTPYGILFLEG